MATAFSLFAFNLAGLLFVWVKFGFQPYTKSNLIAFLLIIAVWGIGGLIPMTGQPFWDIFWRSGVLTILYGGGVLTLRISSDINDAVDMIWKRLKNGR